MALLVESIRKHVRYFRKYRTVVIPLLLGIVILVGVSFLHTSPVLPENTYVRAAQLGSEWFLRQQNDEFIHYSYDLTTDRYLNTTNKVREAVSLWIIAMAGNYFNDSRLTSLAQRGFAYFKSHTNYNDAGKYYYVAITPEIHLAYSAFMILTLLQIDVPDKDAYLSGLARGILAQQNPDGSFNTDFFSTDRTSNEDYYPGEALFALMSLYEHTHDEKYLAPVERALPYYMKYWQINPNTAFTPWQTRAYTMLYRVKPNSEIVSFVFSMNDYILNYYEPAGICSKFNVRKSQALNVHTEGVIEAYVLARDIGDMSRADCYAQFVREADDYLVSEQITDASKFPPEAIGGFLMSTDNVLRVDRNQHTIMALLGAYNAGLLK